MKALVIVAHPDDETIFLGGYILKNSEWNWTIVSATHSLDSPRGNEFQNACSRLSAKPIMLGLEDIYDKNLDQDHIVKSLLEISKFGYDIVFTHNKLGEYGHSHHVTVHNAVKQVFQKTYCFGYNTFSDFDIKLNVWELENKKKILRECYPSQYSKNFIKLFDIAMERIISPSYFESSIEASFYGRNDLWFYQDSTYETARLDRIATEIQKLPIADILEVGAYEGLLTEKLVKFAKVTAYERSEVALNRGCLKVPQAKWCLGDFEYNLKQVLSELPDVVVLAEVLYYFNDYKKVLSALVGKSHYVVLQNVSKFHKQVELFMIEQGWKVIVSANSNPFGLGIYSEN